MLDGLLEDERITIEGVRATRAGAMNAVALAQGGREQSKELRSGFWNDRPIETAACI